MTNPRFALLLTNYMLHDRMTMALAGLALAAVLIGYAYSFVKPDNSLLHDREIYFGFLVVGFILIMAGCAYILIYSGGYA
jgi:hypothetical protein